MYLFVLGLSAIMTIVSYLNARFHRWQHLFYKAPRKFFINNKKLLKYFCNSKYDVPKHCVIEHFSFLTGFILAFIVCSLYWINGLTLYFVEDSIGMLIFYLVTLIIPFFIMLILGFVEAKLIKHMSTKK